MTNEEFSNGFDTLLNSYKHKFEFGDQNSIADVTVDEYEKSLFLTQAQDIIVKSYFTRTLNSSGEGFDDSTRRQMDFSNLVTVKSYSSEDVIKDADSYSENGIILDISDTKALFIINERVTVGKSAAVYEYTKYEDKSALDGKEVYVKTGGRYKKVTYSEAYANTDVFNRTLKKAANEDDKRSLVVVPINYKDYDRMMSKAYNEPLKRQAWRLFGQQENSTEGNTELILRSDSGEFLSYKVRYVKRPRPIVLVDLTQTENQLSIDGVNEVTECELNPVIHQEILQEAVRLVLMTNGIETREMKAIREQDNR